MEASSEHLDTAIAAATKAAELIRASFRTGFVVERKPGDKGLVTEVDTAAEREILEILTKRSPFGILSEEVGGVGPASGPKWIVDPIDGTTNFARGIPHFAVSIALMDGPDVLLGVIAEPMSGDICTAEKGRGAYSNGVRIVPPPLIDGMPAVFVNQGYAEADRRRAGEVTRRLLPSCSTRKFGTTAVELCYVARGQVDAFICSGDEIWDFAAGVVIARESGCRVTDWKGNEWNGITSYVLFSRPAQHAWLVESVRDLQDE